MFRNRPTDALRRRLPQTAGAIDFPILIVRSKRWQKRFVEDGLARVEDARHTPINTLAGAAAWARLASLEQDAWRVGYVKLATAAGAAAAFAAGQRSSSKDATQAVSAQLLAMVHDLLWLIYVLGVDEPSGEETDLPKNWSARAGLT